MTIQQRLQELKAMNETIGLAHEAPRLIAAIEQVEKLGWICERHPGGTLGNDCGDCGRGAGRKDAQLVLESALLEKP